MNKSYMDEVESYIKRCDDVIAIKNLNRENKVDSFRYRLYKLETERFDNFLGNNCKVEIMKKVYTQNNNVFTDTDLFDLENMPTEKDVSDIYSQYKKCFEKKL